MESISWFVPILPGKLEAWKAFTEETKGARKEQHAQSRKRLGISREFVSLVQTPQGDFASVFLEAEDLTKAFKDMASSSDPFDVWFMEGTMDVHGMTREVWESPLPVTAYFDYRDEGMESAARREQAGKMSADTD